MNHKGTKTLKSQRLILRRFELSDSEKIFENWASDPQVAEFTLKPVHDNIEKTNEIVASVLENYEKDDFYQWLIEFEGEPIGSIGIFESFENYEIGYCIGRNWWNNGIVTEALKAVMEYAFTDCGLPKLFARYCIDNAASGKVLEKAGMAKEGHLRKQGKLKNGEYTDIIIRGILKEEWPQK